MEENQQTIDQGDDVFHWQAPEFDKHVRPRSWYMMAIAVVLLLMLYSFFTGNFLFAVIIITASLVIVIHDGRDPLMVDVHLTDEGVIVGRKFYDYDELSNFAIVYKPQIGVKSLYFEFKSAIKPRLSLPLDNMNPLPIRKNLLKYLPEDLERTDQPLSEALAKFFKL